ncbi:MAG TPA: alpha/beta fold hydrolase [Actinopolymorphaceae bacterium]|nr:alpha/beta fold hydrolase [Actinopolymorphaceae bacterium]
MTSQPIRASSVLPARRTPLTLETADGLHLVAELAVPLEHDPRATLVCVHPLPTHGGMMDSHLYRKAAYRLPALADIAVLRFNTRGTESAQGRSEGEFDAARGERFDLAAAIEYAEFAGLPRIWLVGWSFGTDLVLMYGCEPSVEGAILLSPSLRFARSEHLATWATSAKPVAALVPELDDYLRPAEARERFAAIPQAEVVGIEGVKHLWVGAAERALDEIVARVAPDVGSLPQTWDGPMEKGDSSMYAGRTVAAFADVPLPEPGQPDG